MKLNPESSNHLASQHKLDSEWLSLCQGYYPLANGVYCFRVCALITSIDEQEEVEESTIEDTGAMRSALVLTIPGILLISVIVTCDSQVNVFSDHSPFDIDVRQTSGTEAELSSVNMANVQLPENTQFLWYFSPTRDPITWMLIGVGEKLLFTHKRAEANGLLNLTVRYPNGVRKSVARPLRKYVELEVHAFANGQLLNPNFRAQRVDLEEGDDYFFECVFHGSPTNLKIILPDDLECRDQSLDATADSITVRCENLRFRKGQYGCEGESEEKKLILTMYLHGNGAATYRKLVQAQATLFLLAFLALLTSFMLCAVIAINSETVEKDKKSEDYLYLQSEARLPQSYVYSSRVGFPPGTIGSEHVPVVLPPFSLPGRSRMRLWYRVPRNLWVNRTSEDKAIETRCQKGSQTWLECVFRWMHFLHQHRQLSEAQHSRDGRLKRALEAVAVDENAFRMEYIAFYCHLRRVWQTGQGQKRHILPDPYGICPRVCGDRSGIPEEDEIEAKITKGVDKPERRVQQCQPPIGLPTVLTTRCVPDPGVGLHTSLSYTCQCPANEEYYWMCGRKICSFHLNWRMRVYWDEEVEKESTGPTWRLDPLGYYHHLHCSREGTLDISYICVDIQGNLDHGFMKPHCRKAEYCVCKPQYYGLTCSKMKNPCEQAIGDTPPGGIACRVAEGNKCIPDIVSGSFACKCLPSYRRFEFTSGPLIGRDNCAEQVEACGDRACQHGRCLAAHEHDADSDRVKVAAKCVCENGWRGRYCSHPHSTNSWTAWTEWTVCQPSCQHSLYEGNRLRHRWRRCLDPYGGDCQFSEGSDDESRATIDPEMQETRLCRSRPCNRYLRLSSPFILEAPPNSVYIVRRTMTIVSMVVLFICIMLPICLMVALWSITMQSKRAELQAKERVKRRQEEAEKNSGLSPPEP